jgi:hypothetical protein
MIYYIFELLYFWAVIFLNCYIFELLYFWTVIFLSCYIFELLYFWTVSLYFWTVIFVFHSKLSCKKIVPDEGNWRMASCALMYLVFQSFDFERTWWRWFQNGVVCTNVFGFPIFWLWAYLMKQIPKWRHALTVKRFENQIH